MCCPISATRSSSSGEMPRMNAPCTADPFVSRPCPTTYGAAATTCGSRDAAVATRCQSESLAARGAHLHVRRDREDTAADLALKAVHDRQHRDECGHAERDADDRNRRDERDRAGALPGAGVTQPDDRVRTTSGIVSKAVILTQRRHVSCADADHAVLHTAAMNCHLLVPDLFHAAGAGLYGGLALPALETLLARGRSSDLPGASLERWLAATFRIAARPDLPLAALSLAGEGVDPGDSCWLRADPVHFSIQRDQLLLTDRGHALLAAGEAGELTGALNAHFAEDGLEFIAPHAAALVRAHARRAACPHDAHRGGDRTAYRGPPAPGR